MPNKQKLFVALFLIPQIIFISWVKNYPEFIEKYYSLGIYPYFSKALRWSFGLFPWSMGDLFYTIIGLLIIRYLYNIIKHKKFRFLFWDVLAVLSVTYAAFQLFWGLNYYRIPIHQSLNINANYTKSELIDFSKKLVIASNRLHLSITQDSTKKVVVPYSKKQLQQIASDGFEEVKNLPTVLNIKPQANKYSLYSLALTYMGYSGYLNPFTNESQVNKIMPVYKIPFVSCHEQAHQLGYSAENEANFIGFLGAIHHEDLYFKYSALTFALNYCLGELQQIDEKTFNQLYDQLNLGIKENFKESRAFWDQHQNPLEPLFKSSYNAFLKVNNQQEGIMSYNLVVGLLVNYYKTNNL